MNEDNVKKLTWIVNTAILIMVLGLMAFFHLCKAFLMVYFSIPTIVVYLIGYLLISKNRLYAYVWMVYSWIMLYMTLATVCLGYTFGFHLYSLSMIPILYYTTYLAYRLNLKMIKTGLVCFAILCCYLIGTLYVAVCGPIYDASDKAAALFWITNSVIVFCFLITYTKILINGIIASEEKLKTMSYLDRLTGLYNRHYMMEQLGAIESCSPQDAIAMIDLDDFKKVNDRYGHNAGDYVLQTTASIMQKVCEKTVISRWGGEEFLILVKGRTDTADLMETLRKTVEDTAFVFEGKTIPVSVTIGISDKGDETSADLWIQKADENLYTGKKSGKNRVIA